MEPVKRHKTLYWSSVLGTTCLASILHRFNELITVVMRCSSQRGESQQSQTKLNRHVYRWNDSQVDATARTGQVSSCRSAAIKARGYVTEGVGSLCKNPNASLQGQKQKSNDFGTDICFYFFFIKISCAEKGERYLTTGNSFYVFMCWKENLTGSNNREIIARNNAK